MKEIERRKIIEQAKKNFWEQKSEEFSILILVCSVFFILVPFLGVHFSLILQQENITQLAWDQTTLLYPHEVGYWPCMLCGIVFIMAFSFIVFAIVVVCKAIKHFIDSNMETAFERAIEQQSTKSKRRYKK